MSAFWFVFLCSIARDSETLNVIFFIAPRYIVNKNDSLLLPAGFCGSKVGMILNEVP
jgi:hypothetical protein